MKKYIGIILVLFLLAIIVMLQVRDRSEAGTKIHGLSNLIMDIVPHGNTGTTEAFDLSASWQHSATVDDNCVISLTDPGVSSVNRLLLTKDANTVAKTLTWPTSLQATAQNWINGDQLTTMGIVSGQRYIVTLWRLATANSYIASYSDAGVAP